MELAIAFRDGAETIVKCHHLVRATALDMGNVMTTKSVSANLGLLAKLAPNQQDAPTIVTILRASVTTGNATAKAGSRGWVVNSGRVGRLASMECAISSFSCVGARKDGSVLTALRLVTLSIITILETLFQK